MPDQPSTTPRPTSDVRENPENASVPWKDEGVRKEQAEKTVLALQETWSSKPKEKQTFEAHDEHLRTLYRCLREEKAVLAKQVYVRAIAEADAAFRERWKDGMSAILTKRVEGMKDLSAKENTSEAKKIIAVLANILPKTQVPFKEKNGKLVYERSGKDGPQEWTLTVNDGGFATMRTAAPGNLLFACELQEFCDFLEKGTLEDCLAAAERDGAREREGAETLRKYDLPSTGDMLHLRLFPASSQDMVAESNLAASALHAAALQKNYGHRMKLAPPVFTDDPLVYLRELVADAHQQGKGVSMFVIDIFQHGTRGQIDFKRPLKAGDLATLVREFPQCKFQFNTIACFGGGLREGLEAEFAKDPALAERIQVFLQTKPHLSNVVGRYKTEKDTVQWSTMYYAQLTAGLSQGLTYGEAAYQADRFTKQHSEQDAEALLNGRLIGQAPYAPGGNRTLF